MEKINPFSGFLGLKICRSQNLQQLTWWSANVQMFMFCVHEHSFREEKRLQEQRKVQGQKSKEQCQQQDELKSTIGSSKRRYVCTIEYKFNAVEPESPQGIDGCFLWLIDWLIDCASRGYSVILCGGVNNHTDTLMPDRLLLKVPGGCPGSRFLSLDRFPPHF